MVVVHSVDEIGTDAREYLEEILKDGRMGDLDKELHEEMLIELYKSLDNFMIAIAIDHMPENVLGTFRKMVDQERLNDEIDQFVIDHVPNAEEVFANADTLFREYYLGKGA